MDKSLREIINSLPTEPGVYLMKDKAGTVIYVGKAVNLRERVSSYFAGTDNRGFVPLLDRLLGDVETVVVKNEKEALLLENELVHRYKPRFNIKLKEGKNFVYLRLDPRQHYPRLEVTRKVLDDGARYFGPYPLAHALRDTLRVVNKYFKLRTCSDHDPMTHKRPCLLCQISRFPAPSVYDIPAQEYRHNINDAILFLEGKKTELVDVLRERMKDAAKAMRFEEAARIRDQLKAIRRTLEPQKIIGARYSDQDAFGYFREHDRLQLYVLHIRKGRMIGGQSFSFYEQAFPDKEILASFFNIYYNRGYAVPDEVLLPLAIDGLAALEELLSERKGSKVKVLVPTRGDEFELVQMSMKNAKEKVYPSVKTSSNVLKRLKEELELKRIPHRVECFDVSHFYGDKIVASKVAMTDGQLDKEHYRRYKITSVQVGDDFTAMYEVVSRRLKRGLDDKDLPDLLVIDGGKGQLASAQAAMKDLGITRLDVVALAKGRELGTAPYKPMEEIPERLFIPDRKEPVFLAPDSPEMLLLDRLRDEAHRFAITYQRRLMRGERVQSQLENIPGIGAATRRALLRHFGSLEGLREADIAELSQVKGIGEKTAQRIYAFLHPGSTEQKSDVGRGGSLNVR